MANEINSSEVRFIKLGPGGSWEKECIESPTPTIRFGWDNPHHQACLQARLDGDWNILDSYWRKQNPHEATKIVNQIKDFYTLGPDALWITFYKRTLYWCFADAEVREIEPSGSRVRIAINGWRCTDTLGRPLFTNSLSGRLSRVQGFRGTMCRVHERDYLLSRINGKTLPDVQEASAALKALESAIEPLIRRLNWKDFELLIDLVFSRAGWRRLSSLGETQKSIDLELMHPVTERRAFVQVKSSAGLDDFKKSISDFQEMPDQFQEMFFVVHTPDPALQEYATAEEGVTLLRLPEIASLVVGSGLPEWLMQKAG